MKNFATLKQKSLQLRYEGSHPSTSQQENPDLTVEVFMERVEGIVLMSVFCRRRHSDPGLAMVSADTI